jgi:hypothetical protein
MRDYLLVNVSREGVDDGPWTGILLHVEGEEATVCDKEGTVIVTDVRHVTVMRIAKPEDFPWPDL